MKHLKKYRFLILRRIVQSGLLLLFLGGNLFGWKVLTGNYSAAVLFGRLQLADPYATLQILATGFAAGADVLLGALVILLLYGLLLGRMFCSWVCPMNIITDTAIYGSRQLRLKPNINFNRRTRYGVLVVGIVLSVMLALPAFEIISPVAMLHRGVIFGLGAAWAVILAIFLFDLAVTLNGWCGHLCPIGAFYALTGRYALLKVRHNAGNCTDCGKCFEMCHEPQVLDIINLRSGMIRSPECTNCLRCVEVCEDHALKLSVRRPLEKRKKEFISL